MAWAWQWKRADLTIATKPLMHAFDRVLLVANPISGGGRAARWLERVATAFREAGREVETVLTQRAGDAREAAGACRHANALVVAFGGDGTFNEILNGADLNRCALAIIPAGAGNVLAKELRVSWRPAQAVRQLLNGRLVRLDVGVCNDRRFISVFGAGIDAWVVHLVHQHRRRLMTQLHYVPHLARYMLTGPQWEITVEVDGRAFGQAAEQVSVGNTQSYGGPIRMTPAAVPTDGLLDVMWLRRRGPVDIIPLVACTLLRTLHLSPYARYGRGRRVVLKAPGQRVPCEVDGDAAGFLPVEIDIRPGAARLLVPACFRPASPAVGLGP